ERWEPIPITSMRPSLVTSPTMATTFDVPMSKPTIMRLSFEPAICLTSFLLTFRSAGSRRGCACFHSRLLNNHLRYFCFTCSLAAACSCCQTFLTNFPLHCEAVPVTQIHCGDLPHALLQLLVVHHQEALNLFQCLITAQMHCYPVIQHQPAGHEITAVELSDSQ